MSAPIMRCKVQVESVLRSMNSDGSTAYEEEGFRAVYDGSEENKQWSKWTPSANFQLQITNPGAFGKLSSGHEFYIDFTPAVAETEAAKA
jgi:hypothetical protein